MSTTSTTPLASSAAARADFAAFCEALRQKNPFRLNRVTSVDAATSDSGVLTKGSDGDDGFVDVAAIHAQPFRSLQRAVESMGGDFQSPGLGIMLRGDAGVGKSHLLARLSRWAGEEKRAWFVYLHNVMSTPAQMPRHFLRSVIGALVEGRESYRDCALYRMLSQAIKAIVKARGLPTQDLPEDKARRAFLEATAKLPLRFDTINGQIFRTLFHFFAQVNLNPKLHGATRELVHSLVDWLSGDVISRETAEELGLAPSSSDDAAGGDDPESAEAVRLADMHHIEQVCLALCALAGLSKRTLLICLDQVDNLDVDQVRELARFLHALLDNSKNLVLISAGVREKLEFFRNHQPAAIGAAQWDRIAQRDLGLTLCAPAQARDLVLARLRPLKRRFADAPELKEHFHDHAMFPLAEKEFELRFGEAIEVRPRTVLSWAAEAWEQMQDRLEDLDDEEWLKHWMGDGPDPDTRVETEVIDETVRQEVIRLIADRREHPGSLTPDADNLATLVEKLLGSCVGRSEYSLAGVERIHGAKNKLPAYQIEVTERPMAASGTVSTTAATTTTALNGVAFVVTRDGRSASGALRRLLQTERSGLTHRVLVTDDERAPLPKGAKVAEYLAGLNKLGDGAFRHVGLTYQQYAELDALRSVIDQAGDLMIEFPRGTYRALTRDEVKESLHRQKRLLDHPLLKELLTEPTAPPPVDPEPPVVPPHPLIEAIILGDLGFSVSITTNQVTSEILQRVEFKGLDFEATHTRVVEVAAALGQRGDVIVKDHLNGLLLMACL